MKNEHQAELSHEELAMLQIPNSSDAMLLVVVWRQRSK